MIAVRRPIHVCDHAHKRIVSITDFIVYNESNVKSCIQNIIHTPLFPAPLPPQLHTPESIHLQIKSAAKFSLAMKVTRSTWHEIESPH